MELTSYMKNVILHNDLVDSNTISRSVLSAANVVDKIFPARGGSASFPYDDPAHAHLLR